MLATGVLPDNKCKQMIHLAIHTKSLPDSDEHGTAVGRKALPGKDGVAREMATMTRAHAPMHRAVVRKCPDPEGTLYPCPVSRDRARALVVRGDRQYRQGPVLSASAEMMVEPGRYGRERGPATPPSSHEDTSWVLPIGQSLKSLTRVALSPGDRRRSLKPHGKQGSRTQGAHR
jgi:hypothetical protein